MDEQEVLRRLRNLEEKVEKMDVVLEEVTALKNQIIGMTSLIKWVGYSGIAGIVAITIKVLVTKGAP